MNKQYIAEWVAISIHLNLTQFLASNDEKNSIYEK